MHLYPPWAEDGAGTFENIHVIKPLTFFIHLYSIPKIEGSLASILNTTSGEFSPLRMKIKRSFGNGNTIKVSYWCFHGVGFLPGINPGTGEKDTPSPECESTPYAGRRNSSLGFL